MLKMRLQRIGRRNAPSFRVIVTESRQGPKSGKHIDSIGSYNPKTGEVLIDGEKAKGWIEKGVQVSGTVHNMLVDKKVIEGAKINVLPKKSPIVSEKEASERSTATADTGTQETSPEEGGETDQTPAEPTDTEEADTQKAETAEETEESTEVLAEEPESKEKEETPAEAEVAGESEANATQTTDASSEETEAAQIGEEKK